MNNGYSREMRNLLWPPAWEATANEEGWTLRVTNISSAEVDLYPPASHPGPVYHGLMAWLTLNIWLGSVMHAVAWEFEYAANGHVYAQGQVPGDGMVLVFNDDTGEHRWVDVDSEDVNDGWRR